MLVFLGLWFGVFVPSHRRGQVPLPGVNTQTESCHASSTASRNTSAGQSSTCCGSNTTPNPNSDSDQPDGRCAVCHIVATLQTPPTIDHDLIALGVLDLLPAPLPQTIEPVFNSRAHQQRAPPFPIATI